MTNIKLIIGIGNPDEQYKDTRHNVGFMMLDYIATRERSERSSGRMTAKKSDANNWEFNKKLNAEVVKCPDFFAKNRGSSIRGTNRDKLSGSSVILAKAHTYVNKTGEAAVKLKNFYKVKPEQILVIQDDLDVPFGNTKISFHSTKRRYIH